MTTLDKLDKLYAIKKDLHPLTMILIVGFTETQKRVLGIHDIEFIEKMYIHYFKD